VKTKLIVAAGLVALSLYWLLSAFVQDFEVNKYADMQAVRDQNALARGYLPALLPPSAYDIAETHDPDSDNVYGKFSYKESDETALMAKLTPLHDGNGTLKWKGFWFRIDREKNLVQFRNALEQKVAH
jgi:hypothetical protein